jgi:hypothetical protein
MAKTTVSASALRELQTKLLSDNAVPINALRKPLKMTATLKRRALKKKTKREEVQILSGSGSAADLRILSQPE